MGFPPVSADLRSFFVEVARGFVADFESKHISAVNEGVGTAFEDIADLGDITLPTSAEALEIVSASTSDAASGTGARTVKVEGLDGNYVEQSEIIALNGTTAVSLANTYLRTFKVTVLTAGSSEVNIGALTLRLTSGGATRMTVRADKGVTASSLYTVPVGKTAYLLRYKAGIGYAGGAQNIECNLYLKETSAWIQTHQGYRVDQFVSPAWENFDPPLKILEKTDIKLRGVAAAAATFIVASYDLIIVNNTAPVPETEIVTLVNESFSQGEVILVPSDVDKRPFILFAELDKDGLATSIELNIGDKLILKDTSVAGTKEVLNSPVIGLSGEEIRVKAVGAGSGKYKLTCGLVDKIVKGEDLT